MNREIRQYVGFGIAVLLLNAALTFHNVWPTPFIAVRPEISVELGLLLLALAGYAALVGAPGRGAHVALVVVLLGLTVGRYADVTSPALYGRPVNLYWDAQHLPAVASMLVEVAPPALVVAGAIGFLLLVAALCAALYGCLARLTRAVAAPTQRRVVAALGGAITATYLLSALLELPIRHWFSVPVTEMYARQLAFLVEAYAADTREELAVEPLERSDLQRVASADVLLAFLESYGASTYDDADLAAAVSPARAQLEAAAADTGRRVVSAFVESPTFGGGSWLAHATFMSGYEVRDNGTYNLLLTQSRETWPALFANAGFRPIAWMPGLKNPWPEGAFYSFADIYREADLGYAGPDFGWWRIPDQFALAKLDAQELHAGDRQRRFVFFPTINTHIPFRPTPPYQPNWERLLGPEPYDPHDVAASLAKEADWTRLRGPYLDAVVYTFEYWAAHLRHRADLDAVWLLIGDHQPAASVAGENARWDVPVHVVTSHAEIADTLIELGFTEGTRLPPKQAAIGTMRELNAWLLRAFDGDGGVSTYGSAGFGL